MTAAKRSKRPHKKAAKPKPRARSARAERIARTPPIGRMLTDVIESWVHMTADRRQVLQLQMFSDSHEPMEHYVVPLGSNRAVRVDG